MTKNYIIKFITVLICISLHSCGNEDFTNFESKVDEFGIDKIITTSELNELITEIQNNKDNREFNRFFKNKEINEQKLEKYITDLGFEIEKKQNLDSSKKIVNIYIENSGSMFGFVEKNSGFKNAMTKLIVELKSIYKEENIKFNFINKDITPVKVVGSKEYYPKTISNIGDKYSGDSDINYIFKKVLENTSENTISILFSDCVYSVEKDVKNDDINGALKIQKSLTEGVFKNVIKDKSFSTIFVQLTSDYKGTYYTKNNSKITLTGQQIPYYITIVGEEKEINKFNFVNKLDGFKNKLIFTTQDYSQESFYTLIQRKDDIGSYKPSRDRNSNPNIIKSIESIRIQERGNEKFTFSVAVDFSKLPINKEYALNIANFYINNGDYKILKIIPYDKSVLKQNSLVKLEKNNEKPTHIIVFESTTKKYNDLVFSLKKDIPQWVSDWNTTDDSNIKTNPKQSFGIKYLVEGIFEAYQNTSTNKDYIIITINIK